MDENGNELSDPTNEPTSEMLAKNENGIVTLKDYAEESNASRMENYTYKEARLSNAKTGTVVTGFLGKETADEKDSSKKTYSLKYTSADHVPSTTEDPSWTNIPSDAVTGANNNSVDVYMVYQQNDHLTVHYVDGAGNEIADSVAKYLSDSDVMTENGILLSGENTNTDWVQTITDYSYVSAHLGSALGDTVVAVKGVKDGDTYKLQVKYKDAVNFTDVEATDLYLVYEKNNYQKKVEVYYTDIAGIPITDASGQPIKKVYDPSEWTNGTHNFIDDARGYTPDGYAAYVASSYVDDIPNWWAGDKASHSDSNNTQNRILYATDLNLSSQHADVVRNIHGYEITSMTYNNGNIAISRSGGNTTNNITETDNVYKVYILYKKLVNVHDVDAAGNELGIARTGNWSVGYYGANRWNRNTFDKDRNNWIKTINSYTSTDLTANAAYGTRTKIYVKYLDSDNTEKTVEVTGDNINNFRISWQFEGPKEWNTTNGLIKDNTTTRAGYHWKTRVYTGSGENDYTEINGLITDVYMQYDYTSPLTVTVHHIDSEGNKVAKDSTSTVSSSDTSLNIDTFKMTVTNYDATSVYYGGTASTGTLFSTIKFSKIDNQWQYAIDGGSATDITGNAEIYVVYRKKTDGRAVTIHFVDENGNELIDNDGNEISPFVITSFVVSSDGKYTSGSNNGKYIYQNAWAGGNLTNREDAKPYNARATAAGYSFIGEYLGSNFNTDNNKKVNSDLAIVNSSAAKNAVQWYYDTSSSQWYTSHGANAGTSHKLTDSDVYQDYITDIYWVYTKKDSKNLTLHYIHPVYDDNGVVMDSDGNPTYTLFGDTAIYGTTTPPTTFSVTITYDEVAKAGDDGLVLTNGDGDTDSPSAENSTYAKDVNDNGTNYNYYGTFLATPNSTNNRTALPSYARLTTDAPRIKRVRIHDGQYQFLVRSGDGVNRPLTQTRRNQWSYVTEGGRTYTLKKAGDTFSILDSQAGRSAYDLNLTSTEETTANDGTKTTTNTYTSKFGAEGTGLVYTIREVITTPQSGAATTAYDVTVHEWTSVTQHDIWQLYTKHNDTPVVTISNEVVYSGNLAARVTNFDSATEKIVSYKWEKKVNSEDWKEVERSQNGTEWNLAHDPESRSWLDLAADNGELSEDENRTSVKYKVTLTYTDTNNETKNITSQEFSVPYWDQLENGSFETPIYSEENKKTNDYQTGGDYFDGTFYSNEYYKSLHGVWQTTGVGNNNGTRNGKDIEIIDTKKDNSYLISYAFQKGGTTGTADGKDQFAELNAEAAGALYQDVVTHPHEYLNYWLSHRARGEDGYLKTDQTTDTHFDTMYLVIMPSKLAMTSASDGGELRSQNDLENFIANHGGYEASGNGNHHTSEENTVIYRDTSSGVLVVRITSDNKDWHSISVANGYIATSSLTRFFFVAGPTAYNSNDKARNKTVGNMLDAVGFSQHLQTPTTPHYHMVIKKTFSGLTESEVAKLASNRAESGKAFQFKIDEYADDARNNKSGVKYETDANGDKQPTLNGAVLSFTADNSNNFTMIATGVDPDNSSKTIDLFKEGNGSTGVVSEDPDTGDITMTWTLYNNYFPSKEDDPTEKYFKVTEENQRIDGYSSTTSYNATVEHGAANSNPASTSYGTKSENETVVITVKDQDTVNVNYMNSYRDSRLDGNPFITVRKVFSGVTPSEVRQMMAGDTNGNNRFQIVVTNPDSNKGAVTLVGGSSSPYYVGSLPAGVKEVQFNMSTGSNGSTIATWNILGTIDTNNWVTDGSYSVKEQNYVNEVNGRPKITIGDGIKGNTTTIDLQNSNNTWPTTDPVVSIGSANASALSFSSLTDQNVTKYDASLNITNGKRSQEFDLPVTTNIIVGRYMNSTGVNYLVWTLDPLSQNDRAKVISQINTVLNGSTATTGSQNTATTTNTFFQNDSNPRSVMGGAGEMILNYDAGRLYLTLNANGTGTWTGYYATEYSGEGNPEIQVGNSYEPAVRVMKISSGDTATPLKGAQFKLYTYAGNDKKYFTTDQTFGDTGEEVTFETNEQGIAQSTASGHDALQIINGLKNGTYYLEEIKAPNGYNMPTKNVVAITVDAEGIVTQVTNTDSLPDAEKSKINTSTSGDDGVTIDWDSPYYTLTVKNTAGTVLPITGGSGTTIFTLLGLLLLAAGGAMLGLRAGKRGDAIS